MRPPGEPRILTREWMSAESWRGSSAGMWAWLIQRVAAVALVGVIVLHVVNPFRQGVQAALLALVLVHGLLGVRSLLLDVGLPVRWHRTLLALALVLAVALFAAAWQWRWY